MKLRWGAVTVLLASLAAFPSQAQIANHAIKIGVLTDLSGPASDPTGVGSVTAAEMAVEDFGGKVDGVPIQVISADEELKPNVGAAIARRWYDTEHVDLIVGVPVSSVGLAVQEVANSRKKLLIVEATGTDKFTGSSCSPYSMQWAFDTHALAVGTAKAVTKRGGKSWFFLTADYAFGHSLQDDASKVVEANGGKVVGAVRFPFNSPDMSSFVLQAQNSKAKIIGIAAGPPDNVNAIKTGGEFGLFRGGQQMAGLLTLLTDVHALGLQKAQGLLFTSAFYWDMNPETRAWAKRFYAKLHKMPTMWQAGTYSAVTHYLQAIKAIGTDDPLKVAAEMRKQPIHDFFAPNGKLRIDGLMVHDLYLLEVKSPEQSKYPWDYAKVVQTIPGQDAFPALAGEGCPLVKG